jgi:hypothetical protein
MRLILHDLLKPGLFKLGLTTVVERRMLAGGYIRISGGCNRVTFATIGGKRR